MIIICFILSLFFWLFLQLIILLVALYSLPAYFLPDRGRRFGYSLTRWLLRLLFRVCFFRVRLIGKENLISKGRIVYMANKPEMISTFALIAFFPQRLCFIAEDELCRVPVLGRAIIGLGSLATAAKGASTLDFSAKIAHSLRQAGNIMFFPANLRDPERHFSTFGPAEIKIAQVFGATIVPVLITGTEKIMPPGSAIFTPGQIDIIVGPPLEVVAVDVAAKKLEEFYGL